jgi:hypothetical protein
VYLVLESRIVSVDLVELACACGRRLVDEYEIAGAEEACCCSVFIMDFKNGNLLTKSNKIYFNNL